MIQELRCWRQVSWRRGFGGAAIRASALGLTVLVAPPATSAQDLAAERARVLPVVGRVETVEARLAPLAANPGLGFHHEIVRPGAIHLRVHFVVRRPGDAWGLQVRGRSAESVWSTWDGEAPEGDFWSDEIPGDKVSIDVYSSMPGNPLELVIDKIAVGTTEPVAVSIVGPNQLSPILAQERWVVELGRSVARLRFVSDDGLVAVCTAFLVTPELMLTNQHCIASQDEMESALVEFDYDTAGSPRRGVHLSELLDSDFELDFSVVRLERPVGRTPLRLSSERPPDRHRLLVIQHPGGEPKQVSLADCVVDGAVVAGRKGTPTDFGHACDTKGGSSGSPVLSLERRVVVGLHHLGVAPGSSNVFNRASHMDLVLGRLSAALRDEIEAGQ
jgi:hypothetical protein